MENKPETFEEFVSMVQDKCHAIQKSFSDFYETPLKLTVARGRLSNGMETLRAEVTDPKAYNPKKPLFKSFIAWDPNKGVFVKASINAKGAVTIAAKQPKPITLQNVEFYPTSLAIKGIHQPWARWRTVSCTATGSEVIGLQ
jgi:hypothetical protein